MAIVKGVSRSMFLIDDCIGQVETI